MKFLTGLTSTSDGNGCRTFLLTVFFMVSSFSILLSSGAILNEDDHQWSPNDQALKDFYDMNNLDQFWNKRAPSTGFYGMRGKKVPSGSFYGMRGKKGPSGFLGVRGKKDDMHQIPVQQMMLEDHVRPLNVLYDDLYREEDALEKRAPAQGFMGNRGKRSLVYRKRR